MSRKISHAASLVCFSMFAFGATAAPLTDAQIARFVYVARQASDETARLAGRKSQDARVKSFAAMAAQPGVADDEQIRVALKRYQSNAASDDFTEAAGAVASDRRRTLATLSGASFDKAYVENEVLYDMMIVGVIQTTVAPATNDAALRRLVAAELQRFTKRQKLAEQLLRGLD